MPLPFKEFFLFWLKIGFISFGGPAGQIALMHKELVENKKWLSESQFLHALNFCMFLPGPEAQQLATYAGWLLFKTKGALVLGSLFIIPSIFILSGLSFVYARFGSIPIIDGFFYGLKASVVALVIEALMRLSKKSLKNNLLRGIALLAFISLWFFKIPFPIIILASALLGFIGNKFLPHFFAIPQKSNQEGSVLTPKNSLLRIGKIILIFFALWGLPYFGLIRIFEDTLYKQMALFFTKMAFVTFGGAYAVLPYMSDAAVNHFGWLDASQMITGLGLAESTPGPLIMVVTFVGFLGGYFKAHLTTSLLAGCLGAIVATYFTFLPSFFFIFLGAPSIDLLQNNPRLSAGLTGIGAAVVGVVANLALYFGVSVLFPLGQFTQPDLWACGLAAFSFYLLAYRHWKVQWVVVLVGCLGLLINLPILK